MLPRLLQRCFFTVLFAIAAFSLSAQPETTNKLIQNLRTTHFNGVLTGKTLDTKIATLPLDLRCSVGYHNYLWYKNKLVVQLDGSGKVFEIVPGDSIKRIDKTCYEGFNFGAYNFVYHDTLFSLGGYGFWQYNGMLRFFDDSTGQWFVKETNNTVPFHNNASSYVYYDIADMKLYVSYQERKPIYMDSSAVTNDVTYLQCLNLQTKRWWDEPQLSNIPIVIKENCYQTSEGLMIEAENANGLELRVYDFKNNQVKKINSIKSDNIFEFLGKQQPYLFMAKDSSFQFFRTNDGTIDSVAFGPGDLVATGTPVYLPVKKSMLTPVRAATIMIALFAAALLLVTIFFTLRHKKLKQQLAVVKNNPVQINDNPEQNAETGNQAEITIQNSTSFKDNLTEPEKLLLDLLIKNTAADVKTTNDEMNQVMGLGKKPLKIQNNIRAAAILMINKKFVVFNGGLDELILKERTAFDRRFFEYAINKKYLSKVK